MEENTAVKNENLEIKKDSFFRTHKKTIRPIVFIGGLLVLFFLGRAIVFAISYASTDNAQLSADIVTLRTSVSGTVERIHFTDNQTVKQGDTLIVFETEELMAELTRAQSQFYSSQLAYENALDLAKGTGFSVDAAEFNVASLRDNLTASQTRLQQAESDFKRIQNMFEQGAATKQAFENAQTELDLAKAQVTSARNMMAASGSQKAGLGVQRESATIQAKLAQANINQAQANLTYAQSEYNKAFVIAPFDGVVSNRNINIGQYVLGGTPLASLVENGKLWVAANFKETQLKKIKIGNEALITVDAFPSIKLHGKVESIGGATGAKFALLPPDNSSGNFIKVVQRLPVKISLDSLPKGYAFKPGYSVVANVKKK
jgi:membrane fusion protein (multidrug efflux system)